MAELGSGGLDLGKIAGPRDNYEKLRIFEYKNDSERKYSLRITEAFSESGYFFWGGGISWDYVQLREPVTRGPVWHQTLPVGHYDACHTKMGRLY